MLKDYPMIDITPLAHEFPDKRQHPILNHGEFKLEMREGGCEFPVICNPAHHQVRKVHNYEIGRIQSLRLRLIAIRIY